MKTEEIKVVITQKIKIKVEYLESKIKYKINIGGSLWTVLAKNKIKEGNRYKTLIYQEKKGNIPNFKNKLV